MGAMPRSAVGVALGVGRIGKRAVHTLAIRTGSRAVGRGAHERMREFDTIPEAQQPGINSGADGSGIQLQRADGAPEEYCITERLGGGGEDDQSGLGRQIAEALREAPLHLADDVLAAREREATGKIISPPGARQLDQRKRVAVTFGDDLITHGDVQWPTYVLQEQRARVTFVESVETQLGQSGEHRIPNLGARGAHDRP